MRLPGLVLAVILVCSSGSAAAADGHGSKGGEDVSDTQLTAEISLTEDHRLRVVYRLDNRGPDDLFVFDRLYREQPSGTRVLDEDMAYVQLADDSAVITRSLIPIPAGLKVEYPEVPYARVLSAGENIEATFHLGLPLHAEHPYEEPLVEADARRQLFRRVEFSIGILERTPEVEAKELLHVDEGIYSIPYAEAVKQKLLSAARAELEFEGLVPDPGS